jgi:acyl-CoA reductase-like NAD-dependent aldehyde dehydrogenase
MTTSTSVARHLRVSQPYGVVIEGEDVAATATFAAIDPSTGDVWTSIGEATGANVESRDQARARCFARDLEAGTVWINTWFDVPIGQPLGASSRAGARVRGDAPRVHGARGHQHAALARARAAVGVT